MKRVVARFDDESDASGAVSALRSDDLDPERPTFDAPHFDPTARLPEARGLAVGALLGGLLGLTLFQAINAGVLWIPRLSPLMSAGEYAVPVLGLGLGAATGGFLGGVVGTLQPVTTADDPAVAVAVPDDRVAEVTSLLRRHGATTVADRVTYHETPGFTGDA